MSDMTQSPVPWARCKHQLLPVVAAFLLFVGIQQVLSAVRYPICGWIMSGINGLYVRAFRDTLPLPNEYQGGIPWLFHVRIAAAGVSVLVIGIFLGLWANSRAERQKSTEMKTPAGSGG